jgi:hypothetical protein
MKEFRSFQTSVISDVTNGTDMPEGFYFQILLCFLKVRKVMKWSEVKWSEVKWSDVKGIRSEEEIEYFQE